MERSGSGDQVPVKDLVSQAMESLGKNNRKALRAAYIQTIWEKIAPASVLEHTDNVFLFIKDGIKQMVVYVDNPIWSAELTAQKERFRIFMEKELNEGPIDEIRFQTSSSVYRKKTFMKRENENLKKPTEGQSLPLTEQERDRIIRETDTIQDEAIRDAVRKAWINDAEWKKWESRESSHSR